MFTLELLPIFIEISHCYMNDKIMWRNMLSQFLQKLLCLKKAQKNEVHALKHTSLAAKRSAHKGDTTSLEESRGGMSYSIKMHERHSSSVYFTEKLQLISLGWKSENKKKANSQRMPESNHREESKLTSLLFQLMKRNSTYLLIIATTIKPKNKQKTVSTWNNHKKNIPLLRFV